MILSSTAAAAAIRFTPTWMQGQPDAPVFLLRAGDVLERELMQADLAGEYQAGEIWPWDMRDTIVDGIREFGGSGTEDLLLIAECMYAGETPDKAQAAIYASTLAVLAKYWPPYRELLAQQHRREVMAPIVAFRRFCIGWENVKATYRRGVDQLVDKTVLIDIDPMVLRAAGATAYSLQWGQSAEKNSGSPSTSDEGPKTSNTANRPKAAVGKSGQKSTK